MSWSTRAMKPGARFKGPNKTIHDVPCECGRGMRKSWQKKGCDLCFRESLAKQKAESAV